MSNTLNSKNTNLFFKSNYDKALKYIIPSIYYEQDESLSIKEIDVIDQVINSHLNVIQNFSSILQITAPSATVFSGINQPSGIAQFFVKQNGLTDIDINDFERKILVPLDYSFRDFNTSAELSQFLKDVLLPGIRPNNPSLDFLEGGSVSSNHIYLINNLSWLYFLNTSSTSLTYNPSAFVHDLITGKLYQGESIQLNDGIKGLTTHIWKNYETCTSWRPLNILPSQFVPPSLLQSTDSYTTGDSQLEKLLTLIDIVYSPLYLDIHDTRVKDAIDNFIQYGYTLDSKTNVGPFIKLLKAFSFGFADYSNKVDRIQVLNDLDECPEDLLPYLAELIGWKLFGSEPDRWRLQLANAINIYKYSGTKKSIQFAVDAVLGQDVFDVSSIITELWESYIPHLIYYALATESTLLEDYSTWTRTVANNLGITYYNTSSFDDNVRLCVDQIIYQLAQDYNELFIFDNKPFQLDDQDFIFNYRGRDFKVPPFEEYPYYTNIKVTDDLIDSIVDKLVCFSVRQDFALQVGEYIRQNCLNVTNFAQVNNAWLFFTTSATYAPNWNLIIKDLSNTKAKYLSLWNGKSSHYNLLVSATDFDFYKTSLESDSGEAFNIISQAAKEFSPAHSMPDLVAALQESDEYEVNNNNTYPYVKIDKQESTQFSVSSSIQSNFGGSAIYYPSYKRGLTVTSLATFSRGDVDELNDIYVNSTSPLAFIPRRSHRRRNFRNTLPIEGYYSRTGFNNPSPFKKYQTNGNVFFPLGLVPSSLQYVSIPDYNNIPSVYSYCETLNSSNVYNGVTTSNTYPLRGVTSSIFSVSNSLDRGQLNPFLATLHYISEQKKLLQASAYYDQNPLYYDSNYNWMNVLQSYANNIDSPSSLNEFYNFEFGKQFHKLYGEYARNFARHRLSPVILDKDGPTIFAHAFGSLLYNSKFTETQYPELITTDLSSVKEFKYGSGLFSSSGISSGTFIVSSILNVGSSISEYRNSAILSHIELCQTSASNPNNSFAIIDVNNSGKYGARRNSLIHDNVLIKQVAYDGFGRMIFDISKYQCPSSIYDVQTNFLSPEHEFTLKFKAAAVDPDGINYGGRGLGIWIHTKPENGKIWSFIKANSNNSARQEPGDFWLLHDASGITRDEVISRYSTLSYIPPTAKPPQDSQFACAKFLDTGNPNRGNDVIASMSPEDFTDIEIKFNTLNRVCGKTIIDVPQSYFDSVSNNVHRLNQNYVIEIFTLPIQNDKFTLFYDFNLVDDTLNRMSKILGAGVEGCSEYLIDLPKQRVLDIFKYFNQIAGAYNTSIPYASRVKTDTSSIYEAEGGSKINYKSFFNISNEVVFPLNIYLTDEIINIK
jgi:hypothetical protein